MSYNSHRTQSPNTTQHNEQFIPCLTYPIFIAHQPTTEHTYIAHNTLPTTYAAYNLIKLQSTQPNQITQHTTNIERREGDGQNKEEDDKERRKDDGRLRVCCG